MGNNNLLSGWKNMEKLLKKALAFLAIALVFVLLISSDKFLYPEVFTKTILFCGLIEIMVAIFLCLAILDKKYWPRFKYADQNGRKKWNWPILSVSAYVGFSFISSLLAVNPYGSFFGTVGGSNGFFILLHFWAMFIVMVSVFRQEAFWRHFLQINVIVGSVIALFSLYQKFIKDTLAMGTFGNQGHLSGYLLFIIFLSAFLFFSDEKRWGKIVWAAAAVLGVATLFLTTTIRGSQLGFFVGLIAIGTVYFLAHRKKMVRKITAVSIATIILIGLILSVSLISSGKIYKYFERSNTIKTRIISWKIGWEGFLEKPIFGYGLENYYIVFEKHFNPAYYQNNPGGQSTEYAFALPHNKFVEAAVLGGMFGFISYISLFAGIFFLLYRKFLKTHDFSYLAIFGMWISYLVHLFFLFDNIASFFMLFSLLAFTQSVLYKQEEGESERMDIDPKMAYFLFAVIIFGMFLALNYFSFQPARADRYAFNALVKSRIGKYDAAIDSADKLTGKNVFYIRQEILFQLGREAEINLVFTDKINDAQKKYVEELIIRKEEILKTDPTHLYHNLNLSRLYFILGKFDQENYRKSNELLQKMMDAGSRRMEVYMFAGENYVALGQNDKAIELGEKGLAFDLTYGFADYRLAVIYRKIGNLDKAIHYIDEAIKNGYYEKHFYSFYADVAYAKKDYDRAIIAFSKLAKLSPDDPQALANLAMVYFEKKDYAKSRETAESLIKKFPKLKTQIQPFLDKIPKQ